MVAMSVIENEIEVMRELIKHTRNVDEKQYYQDKLEQLEFSKSVRAHLMLNYI